MTDPYARQAFAWMLALSGASAVADEKALQLLSALEFPREQRSAYVERQFNRLMREPFEQRGFVWIEADGTLVMRVQEPRLEERRMTRGQLSLRRPSRRRAAADPDEALGRTKPRSTNLNPKRGAHMALAAIANVLAGDIDALNERFAVASTSPGIGDGPRWAVELIPIDPGLRKELKSIRLHGVGSQLAGLRAYRGTGEWQHIQFLPAASDVASSSIP